MTWYAARSHVVSKNFTDNVNYGEFHLFVANSVKALIRDNIDEVSIDTALDFTIKHKNYKVNIVNQTETIEVHISRDDELLVVIDSDKYNTNLEFYLVVCKSIISHINPEAINYLID